VSNYPLLDWLSRWIAPRIERHALRTGHAYFWYYAGSVHWWNVRFWCGPPDTACPWKADGIMGYFQ
jgi:hypothetical protein